MSEKPEATGAELRHLMLGALGVVYGDIGTSPLYAMKECFRGEHAVPTTPESVFGAVSLVLWTLITIVTLKYLVLVLRADNNGEGGMFALMALVRPKQRPAPWTRGWLLVILGLFGASLLYGEGVITPAISVLSAVEGLEQVTDAFQPVVQPITIAIIVGLFVVQRAGTAMVGRFFGPITLLWFLTLAAMGVHGIVQSPDILAAFNPLLGVRYILTHGWHGFLVLGSVFLCATGAEALYADMGHFGRRPIRLTWIAIVFPALVLNYLGQGALLLANPDVAHPFFGLVPRVLLVPTVILATAATVVASQALISGAFSLTRAAVQLGYMPRMRIQHTSETEIGQIYIAPVNWALMLACIALVLGFGSSTELAAAYGMGVATTMVITTLLLFVLARYHWRWPVWAVFPVVGAMLAIEGAFLLANSTKIPAGGWFPLLLALGLFTVLTTWDSGRALLGDRLRDKSMELDVLRRVIEEDQPIRCARTGVFMTTDPTRVPPSMTRNLVHNRVLHERVLLVHVVTEEVPHVPPNRRAQVTDLGQGFWRVEIRYGFMEEPDIPRVLLQLGRYGLKIDPEDITYFIGRETVLATDQPGMAMWREVLFSFLSRNAQQATAFFKLPPAYVIEVGTQIEL